MLPPKACLELDTLLSKYSVPIEYLRTRQEKFQEPLSADPPYSSIGDLVSQFVVGTYRHIISFLFSDIKRRAQLYGEGKRMEMGK